MNNNSYEEIQSKLKQLPPEEQKTAMELLSKIHVDLSKGRSHLTGTGVSGFIFENKVYKTSSHKDIFLNLMRIILTMYPEKANRIFDIKGRKKKYFSKNVSDFEHHYERIKGTDIFADTNENAVQLNRRCQRILQAFGFYPDSLIVIPD